MVGNHGDIIVCVCEIMYPIVFVGHGAKGKSWELENLVGKITGGAPVRNRELSW